MKKISLNLIINVLLHLILGVVFLVVAIDAFIIINDLMGNERLVENINNKMDKIFTYGSK